MNLLVLLLLVLPFACLALLSLVAFLGVAAIAGALHLIGVTRSALGIAEQKDADPFNAALGDAHPLAYVEAGRIADMAFPSSLCRPRRRWVTGRTFVSQSSQNAEE